MTLEEAQARILELQDENAQLTADKQTLSQENESLKADNEAIRTLNQKYFNRLIAEEKEDDNKQEDEPDTPTPEEFAMTLNI